jgi:hypothetical protein
MGTGAECREIVEREGQVQIPEAEKGVEREASQPLDIEGGGSQQLDGGPHCLLEAFIGYGSALDLQPPSARFGVEEGRVGPQTPEEMRLNSAQPGSRRGCR